MCDDHKGHTSKSTLKLRDGFTKKPGKTPQDPSVTSSCKGKSGAGAESTYKRIFGELPKPIRSFGPKHVQVLKLYKNSAICYSLATVLATIYFCEWKAVLQYLPFYNGKYKDDDH